MADWKCRSTELYTFLCLTAHCLGYSAWIYDRSYPSTMYNSYLTTLEFSILYVRLVHAFMGNLKMHTIRAMYEDCKKISTNRWFSLLV